MRIKQLVEGSGLTKAEICKRANISRVTLDDILKGAYPRANNIENLAKVFGVKCGELFDDWEEPQPPTEFHAYIRMNGKDYVANSLEELKQIVNEL